MNWNPPKGELVVLEVQENIKVILNDDVCYLKDSNLNYVLPLTFSSNELTLVRKLAEEINYLIKKHCEKIEQEFKALEKDYEEELKENWIYLRHFHDWDDVCLD